MRSEYSIVPPHEGETRTKPNQIGVAFSTHRGLVRRWGGKTIQTDVTPGTAFATGEEPIVWMRVREWTEALEIYPDPALLAALAPNGFEIAPTATPGDPVLFGAGSVLRRVHLGCAHLGDIEANTIAHRLAWYLLGQRANLRPPKPTSASRLDSRSLARVADLIERRIAGPLTLDEMAREVGLSVFHFARMFRRATGMSPHQFVMERRIERASLALMHTRAPVEEIASALGFSNFSHFRRVFRRAFGVAPSSLRAR
jgi:AraC family transcriptional regulator